MIHNISNVFCLVTHGSGQRPHFIRWGRWKSYKFSDFWKTVIHCIFNFNDRYINSIIQNRYKYSIIMCVNFLEFQSNFWNLINSIFSDFTQKCNFSLKIWRIFLKIVLLIEKVIIHNISNPFCHVSYGSGHRHHFRKWGRWKCHNFLWFLKKKKIFSIFSFMIWYINSCMNNVQECAWSFQKKKIIFLWFYWKWDFFLKQQDCPKCFLQVYWAKYPIH